MKLHYHPETDSLYIELTDRPSVAWENPTPGVVLDFDADGHVVAIVLEHASQFVNLSRVEIGVDPGSLFVPKPQTETA